MHIMIQITDHVELYYTVWQIIKKTVLERFFLIHNLATHTLEHNSFFIFVVVVLLQPVQRANDSVLDPHHVAPRVSTFLSCHFKHEQTLARAKAKQGPFLVDGRKSESESLPAARLPAR